MQEGVFPPHFLPPIHQGTAANPGINQRALQLLFSEVGDKAADWDYAISVSAAEIYNEALRYGEGGGEKLSGGMRGAAGEPAWVGITPRCSPPRPASPALAAHLVPGASDAGFGCARIYFVVFFFVSVHTAHSKRCPSSSITYMGSQRCHRSHSPGAYAAAGTSLLPLPPRTLYIEITNWELGA